jgi:hypothetical protein
MRSKSGTAVLSAGLAFLAVAGSARMYLEHRATMASGTRDAVVGALYGVAIGLNLLAVWMNARGRRALPVSACRTWWRRPAQRH